MRDYPMDRLIHNALAARAGGNPENCVDDNIMAAYLEGSLSPQEMTEFEGHVSECAACQEIIAIAVKLRSSETETDVARQVFAQPTRRILFRFSVPIPLLGMLLFAAVAIVGVYIWNQHPDSPEGRQVAELRAPAEKDVEEARGKRGEVSKQVPAAEAGSKAISGPPAPAGSYSGKQKAGPAPSDSIEEITPPSVSQSDEVLQAQRPAAEGAVSGLREQDGPSVSPPPAPRSAEPMHDLESGEITAADAPSPQRRSEMKYKSDLPRKVGEKVFHLKSGVWTDAECAEHRDEPSTEIAPDSQEYKSILMGYPGIRSLLPALIRWNGKNYYLMR